MHILREIREEAQAVLLSVEPTDVCGERIKDAALDFGIQPGIAAFLEQFNDLQQQQQQFYQQFDRRLARIEATIANTQISSRNRRSQVLAVASPLRPLQKCVSYSSFYAIHLRNSTL